MCDSVNNVFSFWEYEIQRLLNQVAKPLVQHETKRNSSKCVSRQYVTSLHNVKREIVYYNLRKELLLWEQLPRCVSGTLKL